MKALADLKENKEREVLEHLAKSYSGDKSGHDYGSISEADVKIAKKKLENMKVLLAYESVGDYGCDSSSYFLLKHKKTENYLRCMAHIVLAMDLKGNYLLNPQLLRH